MKTTKPQLLCSNESFKTLGMNPEKLEDWEDGLRVKDMTHPGAFEWWYMDVHADNGYVIVGSLHYNVNADGTLDPFIDINLTKGDKVLCDLRVDHIDKKTNFVKDRADATIGKSFFKSLNGLDKYQIYIDPTENKGYGIDIIITRVAPSYRPGTGIYGYPKDGPLFGWFCAIPGGNAEGKIMFDNQTVSVKGSGYHDHNWGECAMNELIDNWLWSRGEVDGITVVSSSVRFISELGGGEGSYLYMIKDNKLILNAINEQIIALAGAPVNQPKTGKPTPTKCAYIYDDDTRKIIVSFNKKSDIASFPFDSSSTEWRCWYTRYNADLDVIFNDKTNKTFKELKSDGTFEVMDFKGEWIKK